MKGEITCPWHFVYVMPSIFIKGLVVAIHQEDGQCKLGVPSSDRIQVENVPESRREKRRKCHQCGWCGANCHCEDQGLGLQLL